MSFVFVPEYDACCVALFSACWGVQPGFWGRDLIATHKVDSLHECQELCLKGTTICYGVDYDAKGWKGKAECYPRSTMIVIVDKAPGPGRVHILLSQNCLNYIGIRAVCFRLCIG